MFNFTFMPDVGMVMYLWIPKPCLNTFWHGRPYILLHIWKCFYYLVCVCFVQPYRTVYSATEQESKFSF